MRCIFFFSSRRRHTRLQGDWSSDVCSSDLIRLSTNEYYLITGTGQTTRDFDWITRNIGKSERAELVDVTSAFSVISVMGPNARALLSTVSVADLSNEAFPFGSSKMIEVGEA